MTDHELHVQKSQSVFSELKDATKSLKERIERPDHLNDSWKFDVSNGNIRVELNNAVGKKGHVGWTVLCETQLEEDNANYFHSVKDAQNAKHLLCS
jgi:hypothetical protein